MNQEPFYKLCKRATDIIWFLEKIHPSRVLHIIDLNESNIDSIFDGKSIINHQTKSRLKNIYVPDEKIPIVFQSKNFLSPPSVMLYIPRTYEYFQNNMQYQFGLMLFCRLIRQKDCIVLPTCCSNCGRAGDLIRCKGCHVARLCSATCSHMYYTTHQTICQDIQMISHWLNAENQKIA